MEQKCRGDLEKHSWRRVGGVKLSSGGEAAGALCHISKNGNCLEEGADEFVLRQGKS